MPADALAPWATKSPVTMIINLYRRWVSVIFQYELGHHWSRKLLVAYSAPSHACRLFSTKPFSITTIVNCASANKFQWNFNQNNNIKIFFQEIAYECIAYKI